jgi:hypothetical protein
VTARIEVAITCDLRLALHCWRESATFKSAGIARSAIRTVGWHRTSENLDVCPECWPLRPRYQAGHLLPPPPTP